MKKVIVPCLLFITILTAIHAEDLTPLLGTWVNPEYDSTTKTPKFVYRADGTVEAFGVTAAENPYSIYTYTIEDSWKDEEGAHWYKIVATKIETLETRYSYLIVKIGPEGRVYEEDCIRKNFQVFPTDINPNSYFYKKLYRE